MVFANPWEPFHPLGASRFLRERKSFTNYFDFQYYNSIWFAKCVQNLCKKRPLLHPIIKRFAEIAIFRQIDGIFAQINKIDSFSV